MRLPETRAGLRNVLLPGLVVSALAEHIDRHTQPGPNGALFTTSTGSFLQ